MAQTCTFESFLNEAFRDRFVFVVQNNTLRASVLQEANVRERHEHCSELAENENKQGHLQRFAVRK